jgi:hypothetical protein
LGDLDRAMAALVASMLSGAGWGTMSAAAINAIVSPWFVRARPAALGMAYNGGSYRRRDFFTALGSGDCRVGLCDRGSNHRHCLGCRDVGSRGSVVYAPAANNWDWRQTAMPLVCLCVRQYRWLPRLPGMLLWRDRKFLTLSAGMVFGLFAQIGLTAHLFSLLTPSLGPQRAGPCDGVGYGHGHRWTHTARLDYMPAGADRRLAACAGYAAQLVGSVVFIGAAGTSVPLLLLGVVLFGVGFGNVVAATHRPN